VHRAGAHCPRLVQLCTAAVLLSATSLSSCTRAVTWSRCATLRPSCAPALYVTTHSCSIKVPLGREAFTLLMKLIILILQTTPGLINSAKRLLLTVTCIMATSFKQQATEVWWVHQSALCLYCVQTFAANHRLTSEDNELFPSREGSFVRSSGSSFGGRSGSSFTGRLPSRTGPPNLQRFSGSVGMF